MKTAVVLFNLGGPDSLKNVRPFLFNLFADPAIIGVPVFVRLPLALFISTIRNKKAQAIYASLGGKSPLLEKTQEQARALERALNSAEQARQDEFKVFVAMRYWYPRSFGAVKALSDWGAERIVLLPMYPQFSHTTTGSSFKDFRKALEKANKMALPAQAIENYPDMPGFVKSMAALIKPAYEKLAVEAQSKNLPAPRVLLSAHGLPQKLVDAGDPYAQQCEQSARAVVEALNIPNLDWQLCYQSRVGPLEWLKPYTEEEITRAGNEKRPLLIAPLAFTADNSETLYEIDQLYRDDAAKAGVPLFASVPCVGTQPAFIEGLAALVKQAFN
jgi:ferrochelatase